MSTVQIKRQMCSGSSEEHTFRVPTDARTISNAFGLERFQIKKIDPVSSLGGKCVICSPKNLKPGETYIINEVKSSWF